MLATHKEMAKYWGAENLIHYDASVVKRLKIPEESKDFLINVGLPRWDGFDHVFGFPSNDLPSLRSVSEEHFTPPRGPNFDFPKKYRPYLILGIGGRYVKRTQGQELGSIYHFVCLDEKAEGRILLVKANWARWEVCFFNSSVLHFAMFQSLLQQRSPRYKKAIERRAGIHITPDEQDRLFTVVGQRIVRRLRKIDPPACEVSAAWASTLSYYRMGM